MTLGIAETDAVMEGLADARERTLDLIAPLSDADVEAQHSPLMSPLVWDLAHIAAYEDLWLVHRFGGRRCCARTWPPLYDAFETPRAVRGDICRSCDREARSSTSTEVRARTLEVIDERGVGDGTLLRDGRSATSTSTARRCCRRSSSRAWRDYAPAAPPDPPPAPAARPGSSWSRSRPAPCTIGAAAERLRLRQRAPAPPRDVRAFRIGRTPITNATCLTFVEGGGYERREWWTDEGWAWKEQYDITHPQRWTDDGPSGGWAGWVPLDPDKPVVHVSWFEADAFARAHGARLPTEFEWEKAATWDQERTQAVRPVGREPPARRTPTSTSSGSAPHPPARYPDGASPVAAPRHARRRLGVDRQRLRTATPASRAHPYREYSEVFFGPDYKVLRGGSWATARRVATPTFRNWDLPAAPPDLRRPADRAGR